MQQRRRILAAASAGLIAAALFALVLVELKPQSSAPAAVTSSSGPTVAVLVAKADLDMGTQISAANVALTNYPAADVPASAITDPAKAYGQFLAVRLPSGSLVLQSFLLAQQPSAANTLKNPPLPIDSGDEALSIPFDETKGIGGYVQPGDHLDILVSTPTGVRYGFQNVLVLRVGTASANGTGVPSVLVIELPPNKAAALSYLYSLGGTDVVRILLRPAGQTGSLANTSVIGATNWTDYLDG